MDCVEGAGSVAIAESEAAVDAALDAVDQVGVDDPFGGVHAVVRKLGKPRVGDILGAEVEADFLVDLTIPEAHCEVTCAGLEAGLHVVSEKPMAASMDEARKMVATSEKTGKLYMVSQSRRWDAKHASVAATVAAGDVPGKTDQSLL